MGGSFFSVDNQSSQETDAAPTNPASVSKGSKRSKIIKRYQNRKLYDTQQSCYVTLDDIAKMIRTNEEVVVIDNKTKSDITAATLTQIIFEAEKKASQYAPLFTLREIIQNSNGSISSYLSKLGAFPEDYHKNQPVPTTTPAPSKPKTPSAQTAPKVTDSRMSHQETTSGSGHMTTETEDLPPSLPSSNNKLLDNNN